MEVSFDFPCAAPLGAVSFFQTSSAERVCFPHGCGAYRFLWITGGEGRFFEAQNIGNKRAFRRLTAGQGMFVSPTYAFAYLPDGDLSLRWVEVSSLGGLTDGLTLPAHFFFDAPPFLEEETEKLLQAVKEQPAPLSACAAGYVWCARLLDALFGKEPSYVLRVRRYMEGHYREPFSLDDLAAELGINRFYLCRLYKEVTGSTVIGELKEIRLRHAKRLLAATAHSIETVGRLCGFDSASYFIKTFRDATGKTPSAYRKENESPFVTLDKN